MTIRRLGLVALVAMALYGALFVAVAIIEARNKGDLWQERWHEQ